MTGRAESKKVVAGHVWRAIAEYTMSQFGRNAAVLQQWGLTPGHAKLIMQLEPAVGRPMGQLAQGMSCDASTATWLVDRLEERGFVERRPSASDRRVKSVVLTPAGVDVKRKLEARMFEPPPELLSLDKASLEALRRVVDTLRHSQHQRAEHA